MTIPECLYINKIQLYTGDSVKSLSLFMVLSVSSSHNYNIHEKKTYLGPATKIIYQDKAALISGYIF